MDERLRFVSRLLEGEQMATMCREFGISRKTGYKIFQRCKESGLEALSHRNHDLTGMPEQVELAIVDLKKDGAPARSTRSFYISISICYATY